MKNEKGQALVEFVLILPVFLLIILGTIDIGSIIYKKYELSYTLDTVVDMYEKGNEASISTYVKSEGYTVDIEKENNFTTITLKDTKKVSTPVLKQIIGSTYQIEAKRTIYETTQS
jgi:Flp pilus assembly protein TadG